MKENKDIREAIEELEKVSGDEKLQRIAELREKAIRDEKAAIDYAKKHGYNDGLEDGKIYGIDLGIKQEKLEVAKKLLEMKLSIEQIIKATELTKEEIENLR